MLSTLLRSTLLTSDKTIGSKMWTFKQPYVSIHKVTSYELHIRFAVRCVIFAAYLTNKAIRTAAAPAANSDTIIGVMTVTSVSKITRIIIIIIIIISVITTSSRLLPSCDSQT